MAQLNCRSCDNSQNTPDIRYEPDTVGSCPLSIFIASARHVSVFMFSFVAISVFYCPHGLGSVLFHINALILSLLMTAAGSVCETLELLGLLQIDLQDS